MNLIMGMFTAMAALIVGSIWNQHRESANARSEYKHDLERAVDKLTTEFREFTGATDKKHDGLTKTLNEQHDDLTKTLNEQHDGLTKTLNEQHDDFKKTTETNHETTQRKLDKITDSLADARERLARIEGHLGYGRRPRPDHEPDQDETNAA